MYEIKEEKRIFDNYFKVDEALVKHTSKEGKVTEFSKMKLIRKDASAVFIYNEETGKVIFVKQYRYAIANHVSEPVLEIAAGTIDEGELPLETAKREVLEECGYKVKDENIHLTSSFFVTPGYSSEVIYLYHATVTNEDKIHEGGGNETENENIEVVEIDYPEFLELLNNNKIDDGKTLIASLFASVKLHKLE
ncbi:MAG: NUDIX hydrolase [Bacteroidota bacterium]